RLHLGVYQGDSFLKTFSRRPQEDVSVCRTVTPSAAMGIIAPRDFVDVIAVRRYEDGTFSSNGEGACPFMGGDSTTPVAAFVSLWPGKTQVLSFFQTDLGGLLPRSVVDSFFPSSMMDFYGNLTKAALAL
uniref:StAR related lipid transfer domain containing 5 n=1 Tax=Oryzias sinensis TaxID=183150 RepID=A0A8C7X082_9TELE